MHGPHRILIIEDEWIIIGLIEDILRELGYAVSGTAHNIQSACEELGKRNYDAVLLDLGLGSRHSSEIADMLLEAGTPFALVTGYGHAFEARHINVPLLRKPFRPIELQGVLEKLVSGPPVPVRPRGGLSDAKAH